MFVNGKKIVKLLNQMAPFENAQKWDNVGFLIGNEDLSIDRVLVALEVTDEVIEEAISESCDLIVTHHPLIFSPMKTITVKDPIGQMVLKLVKHDIKVIAAHTNLDAAVGGLNDFLAELLNADNVKQVPEEDASSILRVCDLPFVMSLERLCEYTKEQLSLEQVKLVKSHDSEIRRVAICTGAGMDFMKIAKEYGATTLITGDVKYHEAMTAKQIGVNVIDAGHFETENIYMERLAEKLHLMSLDQDYEVKFLVSKVLKSPFSIK